MAEQGWTGWLVEMATAEGPRWAKLGLTVEWVPDSLRATHLCRHEDAVQIAKQLPGTTVTEHMWGDAPLPTAPPETVRTQRGSIASEIARLFGMPPTTQRFTLRGSVDAPLSVACECLATEADAKALELGEPTLATKLLEYDLVPRVPAEPVCPESAAGD